MLALVTFVTGSVAPLTAQQPASSLKIVVLEGEGGVNIIQQKTAVRPLVEVRDRNNLPVAGASVTFTIGGGGQGAAFAGGAQTLTVTTNAAGQAAASGLNALSSGAVQIQVQAAYQGQIATAAISQTNFATAAAASQAGASAGSAGGGSAGASGVSGGAAGGGGGISGTTLGVVGAAVGGGALVAAKTVLNKSEGDGDANGNGNGNDSSTGASFDNYNGTMSGQLALVSLSTNPQGQASSCTRTHTVSGPVRISLSPGNANGNATLQFTGQEIAFTAPCGPVSNPITFTLNKESTAVTGGPSALTFRGVAQLTSVAYAVTFTGSLSGTTITGTLGIDVTSQGPFDSTRPNYTGSTSFPVTLTK
jgi:hypothetical protein